MKFHTRITQAIAEENATFGAYLVARYDEKYGTRNGIVDLGALMGKSFEKAKIQLIDMQTSGCFSDELKIEHSPNYPYARVL